jgi:branched-chain amino acid transport system substrate-binding protein
MRKLLLCVFIVVSIGSVFAGGEAESSQDGWTKIDAFLIGAANHITGPTALTGERRKNGYELAAKEVNAAGGINGLPVQMVYEDDQGTNPGCVAATNKLLSQSSIIAFLVDRSTMVNAIHPIILEGAVPTFFGASAWSISELKNPWFFRMRVNDKGNAEIMAKFLVENLKKKRIASLYAADTFGEGGHTETQAALKTQYNITPVIEQKYTSGTKDYTAQLLAIKAADADVIYSWGTNSEDNAIILRQFKQLGLDKTMDFIGSAAYATAITINLAGSNASGIYSIYDFAFEDTRPELQHWIKAYRAAYNDDPDFWNLNTYDMVKLVCDAAKRANIVKKEGNDFYIKALPEARAALADAVRQTQGFRGAAGDYTCDKWQNMIHNQAVVKIVDGNLELVSVVSLDIQK